MNEEQGFLVALAADPFDSLTRLVYADWLAENGRPTQERDERAVVEGYAAIKTWSFEPCNTFLSTGVEWWRRDEKDLSVGRVQTNIPADWFDGLRGGEQWPVGEPCSCREYPSAREAFDDLAFAFTLLPAARRAELLRGVPT